MTCPRVTTLDGEGGPKITERPLPFFVEHLMNLENRTVLDTAKMEDCFKVCITNFTGITFPPRETTTTEVAYIEGVTARKSDGYMLVRSSCTHGFDPGGNWKFVGTGYLVPRVLWRVY